MILTRLGNKRRMSSKLNAMFPPHRLRIELFFGAGGSFFYLPKPKFSILNDADDDVTNLYRTLLDQKDALRTEIARVPISESLINYWKQNLESDPVRKALRFLVLSNFTYLGKGDTLRLGIDNTKINLLDRLEPTFEMLQNAKILNADFREVLPKISFSKSVNPKKDAFVYLDPVYLDTEHYYRVPKWTVSDSEDCFRIMKECGIKCAMSEFDHPQIIALAKKYGMNIINFDQRVNIKNRRQEILITNYSISQQQFYF